MGDMIHVRHKPTAPALMRVDPPNGTFQHMEEDSSYITSLESASSSSEDDGTATRRKAQKLNEFNKPRCKKCVRGHRRCRKEIGGGACYKCVKNKYGCDYSKGGNYNKVDKEEEETQQQKKGKAKAKGKGKAKGKQGKGKQVLEDDGPDLQGPKPTAKQVLEDDDGPDPQGPKPTAKYIEISDAEPQIKPKRQPRAAQTRPPPKRKPAAARPGESATKIIM